MIEVLFLSIVDECLFILNSVFGVGLGIRVGDELVENKYVFFLVKIVF